MEDLRLKAKKIYHTHLCTTLVEKDRQGSLNKAYEAGMIPKKDYEVGSTYVGHCRNAGEAVWDGERFAYERHKFGDIFTDYVECPEDDIGYDIFVPVAKKEKE